MAEIVNMQNICKSYYMGEEELKILHDVNLRVNSGEFYPYWALQVLENLQ